MPAGETLKFQKVSVVNPKWDRCARKGVIEIGDKRIRDISFAPAISQPREMDLIIRNIAGENLAHIKVCVVKMHDAGDTIRPVLLRSKMGSIDSEGDYTVKNVYANRFLDTVTVIIDPATDSMKYEAHMREFSISPDVHPELRRFAGRMEGYRVKKNKGSRDEEGESYESRIKREYSEFWDLMMQAENIKKLVTIIHQTIAAQFKLGADIGLAPVPVIDSLRMLDFTKTVNRLALSYWPEDQRDTAATYLVLAPEVFSNPFLMGKITDYVKEAETKFIVIKFKNLEVDQRNKVVETEQLKKLLEAITEVKHNHGDERVFVALEAGVQNYLFALGGFDMVSTSMTGMDGDYPFRRSDKNAINGYFDITTLTFRDDRYVREMLINGGFPHDGCICERVKDYQSAKVDWYDIRREYYVRRMDELCAEIWSFVDEQKVELGKQRLSRSRLSNLKHAIPFLEYA